MRIRIVSSLLAIAVLIAVPLPAEAGLFGLGGGGGLLGGGSGGSSSSGSTSAGVPGVATVSVNSDSGGTQANGTVLGGGGSTINVGLGGLIGGDSNLGVTLPGTGNSSVDGTLGGVVDTVNGLTGNGGTVNTLLGDTGLSGPNGGLGGALGGNGGLLGSGGTGGLPGGPGAPGAPGDLYYYGAGGQLMYISPASLATACPGQNPAAIAKLIQSRRYTTQALRSWARAANVQLIPVKLCGPIKAAVQRTIAANGMITSMQQAAGADPLISVSLSRARRNADDVLAIDQANGTLTVYVD